MAHGAAAFATKVFSVLVDISTQGPHSTYAFSLFISFSIHPNLSTELTKCSISTQTNAALQEVAFGQI